MITPFNASYLEIKIKLHGHEKLFLLWILLISLKHARIFEFWYSFAEKNEIGRILEVEVGY